MCTHIASCLLVQSLPLAQLMICHISPTCYTRLLINFAFRQIALTTRAHGARIINLLLLSGFSDGVIDTDGGKVFLASLEPGPRDIICNVPPIHVWQQQRLDRRSAPRSCKRKVPSYYFQAFFLCYFNALIYSSFFSVSFYVYY